MNTRPRWSNPVENLKNYVMVHTGIDYNERLLDVEWVQDVIAAADLLLIEVTQAAITNKEVSRDAIQRYREARFGS